LRRVQLIKRVPAALVPKLQRIAVTFDIAPHAESRKKRSPLEHTESFAITDATGQVLCYVYFEDEPGAAGRRRSGSRETRRGE
jgi:hypothetical protein